MKKLSVLITTVVLAFALGACGKDEGQVFSTSYAGHYETLNYLITQSASDSQVFANMVDGLVENDAWGNIVPSLATEWSSDLDDNGKQVWSFKIREGVKWQTNDGKDYKNDGEVAYVTANDWVSAAKYILTPGNNSELTGLMFMFIDGAQEYYTALKNGETVSFDTVGVKAVDDYTLEYRLTTPAPYFLSALTYNVFYPVYEPYLLDEGTDFGKNGNKILVNGAYFLTGDVKNQTMVLSKNENYWDAEQVHVEKVKFIFTPDQAGYDWARNNYEAGTLSSFRLRKEDTNGWKKYVEGKDGTGTVTDPASPEVYIGQSTSPYTYYMQWNFDRQSYEGTKKTEQQITDGRKAILNANFRLGFLWGFDRTTYMGYYTGDKPNQWLRSTFNPRELGIDQNGKDYIDHVVDVYAENQNVTVDVAKQALADSVNERYNVELAKQYFEAAKTELQAQGVTFPVVIETVGGYDARELGFLDATLQKFNTEFKDYVVFETVDPRNNDEWSKYSNELLSYDIRWYMGWGPDYQDPYTYLHTFVKEQGEMLAYSGLNQDNLELQEQLLGEYTRLVEEGHAIWEEDKIDQRFAKFAEAEYYLIYKQALVVPFFSPTGEDLFVSNIKPYTAMKASYGLSDSKFKGMVVLDEPITREVREQLKAEYEASNPANQG